MVNGPTTNRLPSHGELVASVELLIAHVTQLTNRLDEIESRVIDNLANNHLEERMTIAYAGYQSRHIFWHCRWTFVWHGGASYRV